MIQNLGKIVVAASGTPVKLTTNRADLQLVGNQGNRDFKMPPICNSIYIEALESNTGYIYVGTAGMVIATMVNVLTVIPVPTGTAGIRTAIPARTLGSPDGVPNVLNPNDFWIDADEDGDGIVASFITH